ncbi:ABC transporter permease [Maricurvus nonylphenolicus]|uniref:ABC transporter permease n=1 Tax=Maricurvus nonylphenolicus TaxID=1008307 RepID=UPI0036F1FE54
MFSKLALKSLLNRKGSVLLTLMAMTVSVFVLLGVEHIRHQAKSSFANTVSGMDLIVGSRTGSLNLLLYSVFRIGSPTNNIDWDSYQDIANNPKVKWAIPITLGDSHKGYRVMGTTQEYFEHFSYGQQHPLAFKAGKPFEGMFDVVIGSDVAKKLGYSLGDNLVLAHGIASTSFSLHDDLPFAVTGILKPTGTPVDQTLHVSLAGIEAIHVGWKQGVKIPGQQPSREELEQLEKELHPASVTALMVGLTSRMATFHVQRNINNYRKEPLMAILPGVALSELWQMMGILENTLLLISILVFASSLLGLSAMQLSSIREREREIQLLRVVGAPPSFLFLLIELEALLIAACSVLLGAGLLSLCLLIAKDVLVSEFGLHISMSIFSESSLYLVGIIIVASSIAAIIPSLNAYAKAKSVRH